MFIFHRRTEVAVCMDMWNLSCMEQAQQGFEILVVQIELAELTDLQWVANISDVLVLIDQSRFD